MVIYCVMPMLWDDMASYQTWIFMAGICWCIAETTRYPFYQFKSLQPILGHLRYNLFIVCYPIGVTGELLCFYGALLESRKLPASEKPWSVQLPNTLNFAFDFELFTIVGIPVIYLACFPGLYMYMLAQRKKFYGSEKQKS
jgi:very-long-chain (3R)-3-hydroxyacyl-CoA dehydratase